MCNLPRVMKPWLWVYQSTCPYPLHSTVLLGSRGGCAVHTPYPWPLHPTSLPRAYGGSAWATTKECRVCSAPATRHGAHGGGPEPVPCLQAKCVPGLGARGSGRHCRPVVALDQPHLRGRANPTARCLAPHHGGSGPASLPPTRLSTRRPVLTPPGKQPGRLACHPCLKALPRLIA